MAYVKIVVAVPVKYADKIRKVANDAGASRQGNYDFSSGSIKQIGRFRPLPGAKPAVGKVGKIEAVAEERIEFICDKKIYKKVVQALKRAHPYEAPASMSLLCCIRKVLTSQHFNGLILVSKLGPT